MRRFFSMAFAGVAIMSSVPASAQDGATPEPVAEKRWSVAVSGGTATSTVQADQPFVRLSVTRNFDESYVQVAVLLIDGGDDAGTINNIPATTRQIKLGAGTAFGAFSIDGYAAIGDRNFNTETFGRRNGQMLSVASNGSLFSVGGTVTYDIALAPALFLSPYAAIDYSRITTARALMLPGGMTIARESLQKGVTGSGGAALQYLFGQDSRSAVSLNATYVATSNDAAVNRSVSSGAAARALGILDGTGQADQWAEFGVSASFALSRALNLDLSVVRTAGQDFGESTSLAAGVRLAF